MKLLELRNNCFLEIFEFLTFSDIANLRRISKFFHYLVSSNHQVIQNLFTTRYCIGDIKNFYRWDCICREIQTAENSNTRKKFYPFYTDGGTYHDLHTYFIQSLVNDGVHCTVAKNNVLIKYCFIDYQPEYDQNPLSHKISDTIFYIKTIEELMESHRKFIPMINSISIKIPTNGYTCPVSTLMMFSSIEKEENIEIIKAFHNTFDLAQVVQIASSLKLNPIVETSDDLTTVTFDRKELGIAPLLWVKAKSIYHRSKHLFLEKVQKGRFARYFYLLLIEAENLGSDTNIDCAGVLPVFKLIRIQD